MYHRLELILTKIYKLKEGGRIPPFYLSIRKVFFLLLCSFCTPIIGTISHEIGHCIIANLLGYNTYLHYASITFDVGVEENIPPYKYIFILLGGVLQTVFTSFIAVGILFRHKNKLNSLFKTKYVLIYLSLFISREVINFILGILFGIYQKKSYFGENSDEKYISLILGLWEGFVPILMFIFATIFILFIFQQFIKKNEQIAFVLISFIGGASGMYFWIVLFGKKILP